MCIYVDIVCKVLPMVGVGVEIYHPIPVEGATVPLGSVTRAIFNPLLMTLLLVTLLYM